MKERSKETRKMKEGSGREMKEGGGRKVEEGREGER